jgi:hypothetical protein
MIVKKKEENKKGKKKWLFVFVYFVRARLPANISIFNTNTLV